MKRHTTRKRNRLLKRMAARRVFEQNEALKSIEKWFSYKLQRAVDDLFVKMLQTPTALDVFLCYPNVQISWDNSEISPTTEYRGVE